MVGRWTQGDVLLANLAFAGGGAGKRRPVLAVHDFGDIDLLVVPITSHSARQATDIAVVEWKQAGLKLASTVRVEKLATLEKLCILRQLGRLSPADLNHFRQTLSTLFQRILDGGGSTNG